MNKNKMVELAQNQLDAYNLRDVEKFAVNYHASVVAVSLATGKVLFEGLDLLRAFYKKFFENTPNLNCKLVARHVLPNSVIDIEFVTGNPAHPSGLEAVAVYNFKDDKISKIWFAT